MKMNKQDRETVNEKMNSILVQQYNNLINQLEQNLLEKLPAMANKKKSIYIIICLLNGVDFHGYSTRTIYESYYDLCQQNDVQNIFSDVEFSRLVCKWFDYEVVDKKRKGKKYRVFKKVQDESESSRWVQDCGSR